MIKIFIMRYEKYNKGRGGEVIYRDKMAMERYETNARRQNTTKGFFELCQGVLFQLNKPKKWGWGLTKRVWCGMVGVLEDKVSVLDTDFRRYDDTDLDIAKIDYRATILLLGKRRLPKGGAP
jgi:hypothetical protein